MAVTNRGYPTIIQMQRQVEALSTGLGSATLSVTTEAVDVDSVWTPPDGLVWVDIIAVAGGASGAGSGATTAAEDMSVGSGGGGGEIVQRRFSAEEINASVPITIGGGGVAQVGQVGGGGAPTVFGSFLSATGGTPGINQLASTTALLVPGGRGGRFPSPPLPAQFFPGGHGGEAIALPSSIIKGGDGGYCLYGDPGIGPLDDATPFGPTAMPGTNGNGYGAGGSGAITRGAGQPAQIGGNGAPGVLFIFSHTLV